jgi:hypothetical protein
LKLSLRTALLGRRTIVALAAALTLAAGLAPASPASAADAVGSVKPTASNTGVPAGKALTRYNGDLTITQDGTVVDGKDIYGFVIVRAANVVIKNSIVRGSGPGSFNTGLVSCYDDRCKNLVVQDSTLAAQKPSVWLTGVLGHDFTARRVNVYNVVDGFGIHNTHNNGGPVNVTLESSYCHDLSWFAVDPNHSNGPTHNDCVQIQGGSNIKIVGNTLNAFMSTSAGNQSYPSRSQGSAVMVTPNVAPVTGTTLNLNWIDGGVASVALSRGNYSTMNLGSLGTNRFGRNQFDFGNGSKYVIRIKTGVTASSLTSNTWDGTSTTLAVGRDLGIRYDA